jgi:hypothetical protein
MTDHPHQGFFRLLGALDDHHVLQAVLAVSAICFLVLAFCHA